MKVLLVSEFFLPRPYGGGVSRHLYDLARYLHEQGDEVHVLTSKFPLRGIDDTFPKGIEVLRRLNPVRTSTIRVGMIYDSLNLVKELDRIGNRYDIIHVHGGTRLNFLYRHKLSVPVIATLHGISAVCAGNWHDLCKSGNAARCTICYVKKHPALTLGSPAIAIDYHYHYKLMKRTLTKISKIICVSDYVRRQVTDYFGIPKFKIITITNAVNLDDFHNIQRIDFELFKEDLARGHDKIILFVGRLVHEKGVHVLISSMPEILRNVNARLVIVGDGPIKKSLEGLVQQCNLNSHVLLAGNVDDRTLRLIYQIADVSVVPSLYEPFGITAIEAFAARTPLVVADSGGLSEIVENGKTGVKVIPNDAASLAKGVTKILLDPSFAESLRTNAYAELLDKYTWRKVGGKIRNLYKSLVG
jgi:glycosyltransferase involved in cell wall biosynthesis